MTYFRDSNESIVITSRTTEDGITWEPWTDGESIGFRAIEVETGRAEIVKLTPTDWHEVNPENGATADVFLYHVTEDEAAEEIELVATYVNLFEKKESAR